MFMNVHELLMNIHYLSSPSFFTCKIDIVFWSGIRFLWGYILHKHSMLIKLHILIKKEIASLRVLHRTEQKTEKLIIFKYYVFYGW